MKNIRVPLLAIGLFFITLSGLTQESSQNIYVWEFTTKGGEVNDLTRAVTDQFEEALVQSNCCNVLQRRLYARLLEHKNNEKRIRSLDDLSAESKEDFQSLEANAIIFGEIYEDNSSGQVKFTINVESFNNKIHKIASVYLPKYEVSNPFKREEAMKDLIYELGFSSSSNKPIQTQELGEWKFELMGCFKQGNTVTCKIIITSLYRDRTISFYGGNYSFAYDEFNYQNTLSSIKIGNTNSSTRFLVADIPTECIVVFPNISNRATKFTLIKLSMTAGDLTEKFLQFRDVPFK